MDRIFEANALANTLPAPPVSPSSGYPTAGNPITSTPATEPGPWWFYMMTEELRSVIAQAGLTPDHRNVNQLAQAIQSGQLMAAAASGTADAINASFTPAITALSAGLTLHVRAAAANTSTAPTFTPNVAAIPAKPIVKGANQALTAGDIAGAGHWLTLQFDAALDKWVLGNPYIDLTKGFSIGDAKWSDQLVDHNGWLLRDGRNISRTTYSKLFAVLGTRYGVGDGSTTFNIGDARGRSPLGAGQGTGLTNRLIGEMNGEENHILTINEMPSHNHELPINYVRGGGFMAIDDFDSNADPTTNHYGATFPRGGNAPHNNMHPYIALNPFIYAGV